MEVVTFIDSSSNVASCSLFDVEGTSTLANLREKLLEEVEELMPKDFLFMHGSGVPISKQQESKLFAQKVATSACDTSDFIIKYKAEPFDENMPGEETGSGHDAQMEDGASNVSVNAEVSAPENNFFGLRSPTSCSIKGIKIYTGKEIDDAVGREKERRRFWNRRAKHLAKATNLKKSELYSKVHEEWRLHKTEVLLGETSGLKAGDGIKKDTLGKNIRVNDAQKECEKLKEEIKSLQCTRQEDEDDKRAQTRALQELRSKLAFSKSNLRKAQDALRKTVKKSNK